LQLELISSPAFLTVDKTAFSAFLQIASRMCDLAHFELFKEHNESNQMSLRNGSNLAELVYVLTSAVENFETF